MKVTNEMVDRFLTWKLPKDFSPDHCISFDRESAQRLCDDTNGVSWPTGTNLLSASQARAMLEYVLQDNQSYAPSAPTLLDVQAAIEEGDIQKARNLFNRGVQMHFGKPAPSTLDEAGKVCIDTNEPVELLFTENGIYVGTDVKHPTLPGKIALVVRKDQALEIKNALQKSEPADEALIKAAALHVAGDPESNFRDYGVAVGAIREYLKMREGK